jgi:hypothetical protein
MTGRSIEDRRSNVCSIADATDDPYPAVRLCFLASSVIDTLF